MTFGEEQAYIAGQRAALAAMLQQCIRDLGHSDTRPEYFIAERLAAVAALRRVCAAHGDNDWPDNLHLADVIEKHLERHLPEGASE
jgi:hypothetical protein